MFLNDKNLIIDWIHMNSLISLQSINDNIEFIEENNEIVVNYKSELYLNLLKDINTLPINFGTIYGNFSINDQFLKDFYGFPNVIKGNLYASNGHFKSGNGWNIKEITGTINVCGRNCELTDLEFLRNTEFKYIYLKIANSIFKENIERDMLSILSSFKTINESNFIIKSDLLKYLNFNFLSNTDCDNYLKEFDMELNNN